MRVVIATGNTDEATRQRLARLDLEVLLKPLAAAALDRVFRAADGTGS